MVSALLMSASSGQNAFDVFPPCLASCSSVHIQILIIKTSKTYISSSCFIAVHVKTNVSCRILMHQTQYLIGSFIKKRKKKLYEISRSFLFCLYCICF